MTQDLCLIADITAAQGLRGGLRLRPHSDIAGRFLKLGRVLVGGSADDAREMEVTSAEENPRRVVVFLKGVETRSDAEALVGSKVYVGQDEMMPPPAGKHFIHDLIGCAVCGEGVPDGIVKDVLALPGQDVYVVDCGGREFLVPAVPEIVTDVDTVARRITMVPIEGLFGGAYED